MNNAERASLKKISRKVDALLGRSDLSLGLRKSLRSISLSLASLEKPEIRSTPAEMSLSTRELEVLEAMANGRSASAIATMLYLSPATVKTHIASIYRALNVTSRASAIAKARAAGLI